MKKKYKQLQKDFIPLKEGDIEGFIIIDGKHHTLFVHEKKEEYQIKRPYHENNTRHQG